MTEYTISIPWNKYALITDLAIKIKRINAQFGKTALQKMVFLLQELYGVNCGYDFQFYTYGPFSSDLLQDLEILEFNKGVAINSNPETGGYIIVQGEKATMILEKGKKFLEENKEKIEVAINKFGEYTARDLELRSTIIFVDKYIAKKGDDILKIVQELKPKFDKKIIQGAYNQLEKDGFIRIRN